MIAIKGLRKTFGTTVAVDGITLDVPKGRVLGFLGPNGAGKSTTIRILTCYLPRTAGEVSVDGLDPADAPLEIRRKVGYLPENNPLYEDLEVAEFLEWAASMRGLSGAARTKAIRRAVEACGLGSALGKDIGALSKGFRQRVGLAQAIVHDPPILFLDEPTSGLDPNQTLEVRQLILELKKEKTVVISSHLLSEVEATCDHVAIINKGRIVADAPTAELLEREGGRQLIVVLRDDGVDPGAVVEKLSGLSGVREVQSRAASGEVRFEVSLSDREADLREALFRAAVDARWPLLELRREEDSLETIFRRLTR